MIFNKSMNNTSVSPYSSTIRFVFTIIFIVTSLAGNSLILYAIYRHRRLRTISNLIILNMSVADVIFNILVAPVNAFEWSKQENSFTALCSFTGYSGYLLTLVSIYTLVFVSIERFMATNRPLKHRQMFTKKLVKIGAAVIWIWSIALGALPFALTKYVYIEDFFHCMVDWSKNRVCMIIFLILVYCLCLLSIVYCNIYILQAARNGYRSRARHSHAENSNQRRFLQEHKASLFIFVIVAAFIICWTPYVIGSLALSFDNIKYLPPRFMSGAILLMFANTSMNVVVYGVMNKNFRNAFRDIICARVHPF